MSKSYFQQKMTPYLQIEAISIFRSPYLCDFFNDFV